MPWSRLSHGMKILVFGLVGIFTLGSSASAIVPPKVGSGAVIPLSLEERTQRGIGQPAEPLSRFRVEAPDGSAMTRVRGIYPVPVLLGSFPNMSGEYPVEDFQTLLFDGPWPSGTMKDYYHEISYNDFTVDGTVYGWYTLPQTNSYYEGGANGFGSYPQNAGGFVLELVTLSDPDVDFSQYDNDGPDGIPNSGDDDGYVDTFFAVHAGEGGECGGPWLWSHSWSLQWAAGQVYTTNDPRSGGGFIRVNNYIMMPEMACGGTDLIEIGVYCHEFGHALGLPDLYDGDGSSEGVGGWCLMGSGSWGGNQSQPEIPSHMCAWSKEQMGWIDTQNIPRNFEDMSLPRAEDNAVAFKVWRDGDSSGPEYFLVENRQRIGFDSSLLNPGVLIWHIDNTQPGNSNENHYLVDLEEADGRFDLDNGSNRGDGGDPYPGGSGNRFFNWSTTPNSQDYDRDTTQVAVNSIGDPDSVMTIGYLIIDYPILEFQDYSFDDSGGDDDGVVDIGETVLVMFQVYNRSDTPAESVWVRISSSDPALSFPVDSITLGQIPARGSADNTSQPFTMQVDAGTDVHRSQFTIEFTGSDAFYFDHSEEFMIGHPSLLLVMDDEGDDYSSYYRDTLDSLGIPYAMRDVFQSGSPADTLSPFTQVIWFTGRAAAGTLTAEDQDSLRSFIEGGGDIFLSGQNIAEDLSANGLAFLEEVLGVSYDRNSSDPILHGVQSNQVGNGLRMILTAGSNGANNQTSRDALIPLTGTQAAVVYDTTSLDVAGVTRYNSQTDSRVVFFGFGYEAINRSNPSDTTQATRDEVMQNVMDFLLGPVGIGGEDGDGSQGLPRVFALSQNFPNPFNPMTTIAFAVPDQGMVSLDVYDLRGRHVRRLIDRSLLPGNYSIQWDGRDGNGGPAASGLYIYRLSYGKNTITRRMLLVK